MRLIQHLVLLALASSCSRPVAAPSPGAPEGEVRCKMVSLEKTTDADWTATFQVENASRNAFSFHGFAPDAPLYQQEVLEDGEWKPVQMGWCGTGLSAQVLEPGASMKFTTILPGDGKSYRFRIGEPPLVTPPVAAEKL